ncbi:MAG: ATP-binding cassette domain-containing protein [Parachlamydia sp.]|nr:ATP-binding cassette domain-containing protein [Parachlamydia sp.]
MDSAIRIEDLSKNFTVREATEGFLGAVRDLFSPNKREIPAVHNLSFEVKKGERLAFIGPNGAGKSTTIKILTGILYPTSGHVDVLGFVPWKERQKLSYQIGTVFGQRSQLWTHLPPSDTFNLLAKIYELDQAAYRERLAELTKLFSLEPLLRKPVRQLSLGERMRCEIVASLLHHPRILFLDEPTIGLDINARLLIRDLLIKLSEDQGTTLFLTSHDTADIEQVCERVLILDQGSLVLDSSIREMKKRIKKKQLTLITDQETLSLAMPGIEVLESAPYHFVCEIDLEKLTIEKVIQEVLKRANLKDVSIEEPSMEEIIREIYVN